MVDYMNGALCSALVEVSHDGACACVILFISCFITYSSFLPIHESRQKPSGETEAVSLLLICSSSHLLLLLWHVFSLEPSEGHSLKSLQA